ncbi:hypothetical protein [Hugenholtzia roseola]|uniref:hypothetical protein n=1 Tax=Hugenholtzia roseola TaxID=1002 RepID=UPI00047D34BF|nr:hypothetical protein [Hugenholtzia roseola]
MKLKTIYIIILFFLMGIVVLIVVGYKVPPEQLKSTQVSSINSVSVNNQETIELTQQEIEYWNNLEFTLATTEYPGETPDYVVSLIGEKTEFITIYNKKNNIIFFSFVPEVKYGFLNSPPSGGWIKPLYKTKAINELLNLLKIKNL